MDSNSKKKFHFTGPVLLGSLVALILAGLWFLTQDQPDKELEISKNKRNSTLEQLCHYTNFRKAYLLANGGKEKLSELQSVQSRGTFTSGELSIPFHSIKRRPNQSLTILKFPNYELSIGVNGTTAWQRIKAPGQEPNYELKDGEEAIAFQQMGEFFDPIMNVMLFDKGQILDLSPSEWESQPAIRLDFKSATGVQTSAYFDPDNMRPFARVETFQNGKKRKILYSDYQTIGGMQEPYLIETYEDGRLNNRLCIDKSEYNIGTIGAIFEYPEQTNNPPKGQ
jgi:hypothetical protein